MSQLALRTEREDAEQLRSYILELATQVTVSNPRKVSRSQRQVIRLFVAKARAYFSRYPVQRSLLDEFLKEGEEKTRAVLYGHNSPTPPTRSSSPATTLDYDNWHLYEHGRQGRQQEKPLAHGEPYCKCPEPAKAFYWPHLNGVTYEEQLRNYVLESVLERVYPMEHGSTGAIHSRSNDQQDLARDFASFVRLTPAQLATLRATLPPPKWQTVQEVERRMRGEDQSKAEPYPQDQYQGTATTDAHIQSVIDARLEQKLKVLNEVIERLLRLEDLLSTGTTRADYNWRASEDQDVSNLPRVPTSFPPQDKTSPLLHVEESASFFRGGNTNYVRVPHLNQSSSEKPGSRVSSADQKEQDAHLGQPAHPSVQQQDDQLPTSTPSQEQLRSPQRSIYSTRHSDGTRSACGSILKNTSEGSQNKIAKTDATVPHPNLTTTDISYIDALESTTGEGAYLMAAIREPQSQEGDNMRILFSRKVLRTKSTQSPQLDIVNVEAQELNGITFARYHSPDGYDLPPVEQIQDIFLRALQQQPKVLAASRKMKRNTPPSQKSHSSSQSSGISPHILKELQELPPGMTPRRKVTRKPRRLTFSVPKPKMHKVQSRQWIDDPASTGLRTRRRATQRQHFDPSTPLLAAALVTCWIFAALYSLQIRNAGRR
jgi:hypothetical protein